MNQHLDGTMDSYHPLAFASVNDTHVTFALKEMLKEEDAKEFFEAMYDQRDRRPFGW
jgi:hypothetical protein